MINQEYNSNTKLVNFRVPITLTEAFDKACQFKSSTRTSMLVGLMNSFIKDEYPNIKSQVDSHKSMVNIFK